MLPLLLSEVMHVRHGGGMTRSHRLTLIQTLSRHFAGMIDAHKAG